MTRSMVDKLRGVGSDRLTAIALLGALIVGALLRCPFIGDQSLWYDEVYTHHVVSAPSLSSLLAEVRATESTPPLFYLLTWFIVRGTGSTSDVIIRVIPLIAGLLIIPASFFSLRPFIGRGAAHGVAWLCAVSPLMVPYSMDGRAYALLWLLSLGSLWSVSRVLKSPSVKWFIVWTVFGVLCIYTHYFSVFLLFAEFVVLLWSLWRTSVSESLSNGVLSLRRRSVTVLCICGLVLAASCAPLLSLLPAQNDARTAYMNQLSWGQRLGVFVKQFSLGGPFDVSYNWYLMAAAVLLAGFGLLLGLWIIVSRRAGAKAANTIPGKARALVVLCAIAFGVPLLLTAVGLDNHFYFRNLLFLWPALAGIAVIGLLRLRAVGLCIYVAVLVCATGLISSDWRYQRQDWREAARILKPLAGETPIIASTHHGNAPASYYFNRRQIYNQHLTLNSVWIVFHTRLKQNCEQLDPDLYRRPTGFTLSHSLRTPHGFCLLNFTAQTPTKISINDLAGAQPERFPTTLITDNWHGGEGSKEQPTPPTQLPWKDQ